MGTLRDRAWSLRAMLLVACATLIVGGFTGAMVALMATGERDPGHRVRVEMVPEAPGPRMPEQAPEQAPREVPPRPFEERQPWQHEHFYWNDAPTPTRPPQPERPPTG